MSEESKIITPKFLTKEMASIAVSTVVNVIINGGGGHSGSQLNSLLQPKRPRCHIVVLVPGMVDHADRDYPDWPDYPLKPVCLFEHTVGNREDFELPFDNIARCKALQLWTDRNDDRTDCIPHLLFKGDTPYWGGVKRTGLVVTCSGVQPHIDKLISGMVADLMVAMAHSAWEDSEDHAKKVDFLT